MHELGWDGMRLELSSLQFAVVCLLNLGNGLAWIQSLRADLGAVHDCLAPVQLEGIVELLDPLVRCLIPAVDDPSVSLQQDGRAEVAIAVPPVARAARAAARAKDALVKTVQLIPVLLGLVNFLPIDLRSPGRNETCRVKKDNTGTSIGQAKRSIDHTARLL